MLVIGAAYMLYLTWKTFISSSELGEHGAKNGFLAGLMLQFVNPEIYIYCIVFMEAYILPYFNGQPLALFGFALLLVYCAVSLFLQCKSGGDCLRFLHAIVSSIKRSSFS